MDRSRVEPLSAMDGVPEEELDAVARVATEREFAEGETLMSQGDFGHSLFLIEDGTADVLTHEEKVGTVGPGDVVGEVAVLSSGRRIASVVATSPVRAIALFKRDVWALEDDAPEASRRLRAAIEDHVSAGEDAAAAE
jgi:CRP/FNR family transcriptional regulator, cyclic AMP receptor protein